MCRGELKGIQDPEVLGGWKWKDMAGEPQVSLKSLRRAVMSLEWELKADQGGRTTA